MFLSIRSFSFAEMIDYMPTADTLMPPLRHYSASAASH
jgi:hypothetical protein